MNSLRLSQPGLYRILLSRLTGRGLWQNFLLLEFRHHLCVASSGAIREIKWTLHLEWLHVILHKITLSCCWLVCAWKVAAGWFASRFYCCFLIGQYLVVWHLDCQKCMTWFCIHLNLDTKTSLLSGFLPQADCSSECQKDDSWRCCLQMVSKHWAEENSAIDCGHQVRTTELYVSSYCFFFFPMVLNNFYYITASKFYYIMFLLVIYQFYYTEEKAIIFILLLSY